MTLFRAYGGELDKLIIVPAGIVLVMKMISKTIMEDYRRRAREEPINTRIKLIVMAMIIIFWVFIVYLMLNFIIPIFFK